MCTFNKNTKNIHKCFIAGQITHVLWKHCSPDWRLWAECNTHNNDVELEPAAAWDLATGGRVGFFLPGCPPAKAVETFRTNEQPRSSLRYKGDDEQLYPSSFFSATLRGIALSIRTRSLADRFCRLFTRWSLFVAATHKRGQRLISDSPAFPLALLNLTSTHRRCRRCPPRCGGPGCSACQSERSLGWKVGSAGAAAASWFCCNTGRWWHLCCGLRESGRAEREVSRLSVWHTGWMDGWRDTCEKCFHLVVSEGKQRSL